MVTVIMLMVMMMMMMTTITVLPCGSKVNEEGDDVTRVPRSSYINVPRACHSWPLQGHGETRFGRQAFRDEDRTHT